LRSGLVALGYQNIANKRYKHYKLNKDMMVSDSGFHCALDSMIFGFQALDDLEFYCIRLPWRTTFCKDHIELYVDLSH